MKERYTQLDALRGLAALSVMFMHFFPVGFSPMFDTLEKAYSPFSIFFKGREAVDFFFILSGLVLSLPFLEHSTPSYPAYLIKRFFRIYVPYLISLFIILLSFSPQVTPSVVWAHFWGLGNFDTRGINGVYWSLVHEMRISLIFPFLVLLLRNVKFIYILLVCFSLFALGRLNVTLQWEASKSVLVDTSFTASLYYISMFLYGMLIARHKQHMIQMYRKQSKKIKLVLLIASYICYNYAINAITFLLKLGVLRQFDLLTRDQLVILGVCGFIVIALASPTVS
ncbi:acyltransferase family protein [Paenibacillus cremeus]|uniref:Acyltransferase n=1 Tax=Paenibacillus cremeus TaxID=2163881 RepID=A0A559KFM3_9BACL|nr:acyltransferase [Paenibacillus cremeus]TVY10919.1 acyltransferase [Paenibacillus cremeus]